MERPQKADAVIFDMDGVISDTQMVHATVESEMLAEHGIEMPAHVISREYAGRGSSALFADVFANAGVPIPDFEALKEERWRRVEARLAEGIPAVPGTREVIEKLHGRNIPLAVASASRMSFITHVLTDLELDTYFETLVSGEDVSRGKPAPDIFLLAADRLGVSARACLVIEDSMNGMLAAREAEMRCIGLVRDGSDASEYPADVVVSDLREVSWEQYLNALEERV